MQISDHQQLFLDQYPVLFERVYRFICSRVVGREDAQDLTQQVFLQSYQHLKQFNSDKGTLEQWMISSARYAIIDHWRRKKELVQLEEVEDLVADVKRHSQDDLDFELRIKHLPPLEQALLRLRYVDDLTYEQISHQLNKHPATVRSLFSRLHKKMKTTYTNPHD